MNARQCAVEILTRWQHEHTPIDRLRDELLENSGIADERDRALVTELSYGTVRRCAELDKQLEVLVHSGIGKMQHRLLAILRLGLYQILYMDRIPKYAAVDQAVELTKELVGINQAGLVNAVLRQAASSQKSRPVNAFYTESHSLWQWRNKWIEQWGEQKADELINFFSIIPSVGLRRNRLRLKDDTTWLKLLAEEGVNPEPILDWEGFGYVRGLSPASLPSFQRGETTVQDPAAGIAPIALDPQPGEQILDLCCAPGGKTALLWELMRGEGRLRAVDKNMKRNQMAREGLRRLGHEGIEVETADVLKVSGGLYDRVLVDVPCSGTGVAHRRPDLLLRHNPRDLLQLVKVQRSLTQHAAELVKPGGILIYSTCSLEPEENDNMAVELDRRLRDTFIRDPLPDSIPARWKRSESEVSTWQPDDGVDGVYVVRWRRIR